MISSTILSIPLQTIPNQQLSCILNNQQVTISCYLQNTSLFCDLYLENTSIIQGMKAVHGSYINQYNSSFNGYLFFWCESGLDPIYTNLGITDNLYYSNYDVLEAVETI